MNPWAVFRDGTIRALSTEEMIALASFMVQENLRWFDLESKMVLQNTVFILSQSESLQFTKVESNSIGKIVFGLPDIGDQQGRVSTSKKQRV